MKSALSLLVLVGFVIGLSGCYLSPVIPPTGALYTNIQAPQSLGPRQDLGSKRGEGTATSILGMFAWGDASVSGAARDGGISTIKHTDYDFFNVLGIYQAYTTRVYGD